MNLHQPINHYHSYSINKQRNLLIFRFNKGVTKTILQNIAQQMNTNQNKKVAHVNDPDSFIENGILIKNVDPKETCQ